MTYQDVVQLRKLVNLQSSHNHTFSFIQPNKLLIFCLFVQQFMNNPSDIRLTSADKKSVTIR